MAEDTRPLCKCHGEPMVRMGQQLRNPANTKWACGTSRRRLAKDNYYKRGGKEKRRNIAEQRKAEGLCVRCGKEHLLSEALCWSCLNYMEARVAIRV